MLYTQFDWDVVVNTFEAENASKIVMKNIMDDNKYTWNCKSNKEN